MSDEGTQVTTKDLSFEIDVMRSELSVERKRVDNIDAALIQLEERVALLPVKVLESLNELLTSLCKAAEEWNEFKSKNIDKGTSPEDP